MQVELDRSDLRILDLVQQHGDLSAADVAERLGMTASTCWRRMSRLQELGVIRKRVALLDREKVGLNVTVFSHVKLMGHGRDALLRFEQAVREADIVSCATLSPAPLIRGAWLKKGAHVDLWLGGQWMKH